MENPGKKYVHVDVLQAVNCVVLAIDHIRVSRGKGYGIMDTIAQFDIERSELLDALHVPSDWISCEERMPPFLTTVIVAFRYGEGRGKIGTSAAYLDVQGSVYQWYYDDGEPIDLNVIRWMPMPSVESLIEEVEKQ